MLICDICSKSLTQSEMIEIGPTDIISATRRGWIPGNLPSMMTMLGMSSGSAWGQLVQRSGQSNWGLCSKCKNDLDSFLGKRQSNIGTSPTPPTVQPSTAKVNTETPKQSTPVGNTSKLDNLVEKKEGCYIATAVYGSYEAPEVMVLRCFRDEILFRNIIGRLFIRLYYSLSPAFSKHFGESRTINPLAKATLNTFVLFLKRFRFYSETNKSHKNTKRK